MATKEYQVYACRKGELVHAAPSEFNGEPDQPQCVRKEMLWRLWRYWYNKSNRLPQMDPALYATEFIVVDYSTGEHVGKFSVEDAN